MPDNPPNDGVAGQTGTPEGQNTAPGAINWQEHIPPDLKEKGYWAPLKDQPLATVLKNYGHAQEHIGKAIVLPDKEDDVEGWNKVYSKLGRPESPDKYQYDLPKVEGLQWSEDGFKEFSKLAHANGLSAKQAAQVVKWFTGSVAGKHQAAVNQAMEAEKAATAQLKQEFGTSYDAYMGFAKKAVEKYLGADKVEAVLGAFAGDPKALKGFIKLGKDLAEDGVFGKEPYKDAGVQNPESAKAQITKIMSDRKHAYWGNPSDPNTQAALAEMENLHKMAYPATE